MYNATVIADVFNQQSPKNNWIAKTATRVTANNAEFVHFESNGIVTLTLNCNTGKWTINFNKFVAAWGEYVGAIARSFHTVLNTLRSGGIPIDAPATPEGTRITVTFGDSDIFVEWADMTDPPQNPLQDMLSFDQIGQYQKIFT